LGEEVGLNLYAFVHNDAVNDVDIDGLITGAIKYWKCHRKMKKWKKKCEEDIPKCVTDGGTEECPGWEDPFQHAECEVKRIDAIKKCAKDSKGVFDACIKAATTPPAPPNR
jgi:hypothetical protein